MTFNLALNFSLLRSSDKFQLVLLAMFITSMSCSLLELISSVMLEDTTSIRTLESLLPKNCFKVEVAKRFMNKTKFNADTNTLSTEFAAGSNDNECLPLSDAKRRSLSAES